MLWAIDDQIILFNSRQKSHRYNGADDFFIAMLVMRFNALIAVSAQFNHGE
jgi:hypothetical protein